MHKNWILTLATLLASLHSGLSLASDSRADARPLVSGVDVFQETDKVDPATGNLTIRHKDLSIPGDAGLDIEIWRVHNMLAGSGSNYTAHTTSYATTALGPFWTLSAAPKISYRNLYFRTQYGGGGGDYVDNRFATMCKFGKSTTVRESRFQPILELPNGIIEAIAIKGNYGITKSNWKISCAGGIVTAFSPEGVRYEFGTYADREIGVVYTSGDDNYWTDGQYEYDWAYFSDTYWLANSAEDRFGNKIAYTYKRFGRKIPAWPTPGLGGPNVMGEPNVEWPEKYSLLLSSILASDGRKIDLSYDNASGRLTSITDNSGRIWRYSYLTPNARNSRSLSTVELPTGLKWVYQYKPGELEPTRSSSYDPESRRLVKYTLPSGGEVIFKYGGYYYTDRLTSSAGWTLAEQRGSRVIKRSLSTGETWNYSYTRGVNGAYDTTVEDGPDGRTVFRHMGVGYKIRTVAQTPSPAQYQNYAWNIGSIISKSYPSGSTENYVWEQRLLSNDTHYVRDTGSVWDAATWAPELQSKSLNRDGATYITSYSDYDEYGNPKIKIESGPNGGERTTTYTYYNNPSKWIIGKIKSAHSPESSLTRVYDDNGNVLSETVNGITTTFTYDAQGNLAQKVMPGGGIYTYQNYKRGTPQNEIQPEGIIISRQVDDAGNTTSETNGEGHTFQFSYDGLNRTTSISRPVGNPTNITYTPTSKTLTRGKSEEKLNFDTFGRVSDRTHGGVTQIFRHDGMGRKIFESDPGSVKGTSFVYDSHNRVTRITNADDSYKVISYGAGTRTLTDERNNPITYKFRSYGDPDEQIITEISTPISSANISITLNSKQLIESISQSGKSRKYAYDEHNQIIKITNPENGDTIYKRDLEGNITSRKVGSSPTTVYTHDKLNRLQSVSYPGVGDINYTYNKRNQMLSANTEGGTRIFAYDENGNLVIEQLLIDNIALTSKYTYDGNDHLSSVTYPISNRTVNYSPDTLGRPSRVSGFVRSAAYWPSGQLKEINYENNTISHYGQNSRLWPSSFNTYKLGATTPYLNSGYIYDSAGNIVNITDTVDTTFRRTMQYDELSRLTRADGPWGIGTITYNGIGDITQQTFGPSQLTYGYDEFNRLTNLSGSKTSTYQYDTYGNISAGMGNTYTYDSVPNLRCINCTNGSDKTEYKYDGINMRSSAVKSGVKTIEMYALDGKLLIEYTPTLNKLRETFYLGDKRIAQIVTEIQ